MNDKKVFKWLKKIEGEATVGEMVEQFPELDHKEIAKGFDCYINYVEKKRELS